MKQLKPKTPGQQEYLRAIEDHQIVFALGPAGTGKTAIASRYGITKLLEGRYSRLIISRPLVQAGEETGFLPGDINAKLDPFVRPIYDELALFVNETQLTEYLINRIIEIVPFAYMRGRNFHNAFIVADECQNATTEQLKMLLTRIGRDSKMVVNGDVMQSDLPVHRRGGLVHFAECLQVVSGVKTINLTREDVVREKIVTDILAVIETM